MLIMHLFNQVLILISCIQAVYLICPEKCSCKKINETSSGSFIKAKCGGSSQNKIISLKEINFGDETENIVHLDLRKNQISAIENGDFINYTSLKHLDLSFNSFKIIENGMFNDLLSLEHLKISTNLIVHILQGSFETLKSLSKLDISGNPLACDCDLLWLVSWSNNMSLKLQPPPKCETPGPFKGFLLKKLKVGSDLHCESPLQPLLELKPENDQLVFEGDQLVLRCRAPRVAVGPPSSPEDLPTDTGSRAHVFWGWSDKIIEPNSTDDIIYRDPSLHFPSIQIDAKHLSDSGLLDSILKIPFITRNHTGMWDCRLNSQQANLSRTISVIVISEKTKYCPAIIVENNKGKYYWPRTIRNRIVKLHCDEEIQSQNFAYYKCNNDGTWNNLNTQNCPFISETTKMLEHFSKVNLSIARGSVLQSVKSLKNFTQTKENLLKFHDPIEINFIAETLTNYLNFVNQEKDLGTMVLDVVSQIIYLSYNLFYQAQLLYNSSHKILDAIELAAQYTQISNTHKNNLAIEYFNLRSDSFTGITCTWFRSDNDNNKRIFQCNTALQNIEMLKNYIEASIQIPATFLEPSTTIMPTTIGKNVSKQQLMIAVYRNGNFFPYHNNQTNLRITSSVIGIKISGININDKYNLSEPISLILRVQPYHNKISAPIPVWWNSDTNSWSTKGCQFSYYFNNLFVFSCYQIGYYGLLQNTKFLNDFSDENAGARFRFSPFSLYIGSFILFLCSWINIITYIYCGNNIQMARRQRHSLINTWLAISLLCFIFSIGIFQTEDYRICQIFGILIHYFSLCVLLWICVSVSNMYKRISKRNRIPIDDLPRENIGKKPILGLYLVGWGIGLIICGISSAVNMREYASYSFCFFQTGPALSAIFVPSTILILFLLILFICIRCNIHSTDDTNGHFSEGTQATENVDLELLETNHGNISFQQDIYQSTTFSSPTISLQSDLEHTNGSQLRAYFIFTFLYIICWISAAGSIITQIQDNKIYEKEIFNIAYAITATFLGLFILFFHCISRKDIRNIWSKFKCKKLCLISNDIINSKELNTVTYHQPCETINSTSTRSNSQCSKIHTTNVINHLNIPTQLNSKRIESPNKRHNIQSNLILINRQQFVHNPVIIGHEIPNPEIFYNPNQINVARKFFKKQKRLAKRNNFELQRHFERGDYGGNTSDISSSFGSYQKTRGISIFSSGSKINNTNINVRSLTNDCGQFSKDNRIQNLNTNILTDNCNDNNDLIVDAGRLVLGTNGINIHKSNNKINNSDMIANIYTNVPETLQPQHEIVTMRADDKYRKFLDKNQLLEQDEIDHEENDLNNQTNRSKTPIYANSNICNIMNESNEFNNSTQSCETLLKFNDLIDPKMNTIGLPIQNINNLDNNINNKDNMIKLNKNETYISEPLEIPTNLSKIFDNNKINKKIITKSKSLNNLYIENNEKLNNKKLNETQIYSVSYNNLSQIDNSILGIIANPLPIKNLIVKHLSSSPILFSPSLCEINDLPSPQDDRRKPFSLADDRAFTESNLIFNSNIDSINLFNCSIRQNFTSSPTCESDLNYQNSELSIQSHGVYAPRPDSDINITLNGVEHIFFPYNSSEISDIDDDNENELNIMENNCSNDCLLPQNDDNIDLNGSQLSIDELYQRISRGNQNQIQNKHNDCVNNDTINDGDDSSQSSVISYIDPNDSNKN